MSNNNCPDRQGCENLSPGNWDILLKWKRWFENAESPEDILAGGKSCSMIFIVGLMITNKFTYINQNMKNLWRTLTLLSFISEHIRATMILNISAQNFKQMMIAICRLKRPFCLCRSMHQTFISFLFFLLQLFILFSHNLSIKFHVCDSYPKLSANLRWYFLGISTAAL